MTGRPIARSVVDCPNCGQPVTFEVFSSLPKFVLRPVAPGGHVRTDVIVHLTSGPLDHDCPQPPSREPLERAACPRPRDDFDWFEPYENDEPWPPGVIASRFEVWRWTLRGRLYALRNRLLRRHNQFPF